VCVCVCVYALIESQLFDVKYNMVLKITNNK
jgi:hypothetical protein